MRNSPRSGSSRIGHRCTPIEPLVSRSPEGSNMLCQAYADRQEGELRCRGPGPRAPRPGACPRPAPGRRSGSTDRDNPVGWLETWANVRYSQGRIDLVCGQCVLTRNDDSSIPAEFGCRAAGQAQPGAAQDRVPEPEPRLPSRCWPAACRRGGRPPTGRRWYGLRGSPSGCRWRRPRGRSCDPRTASPAWCRRGSRRSLRVGGGESGSTGRAGLTPLRRSGRNGDPLLVPLAGSRSWSRPG